MSLAETLAAVDEEEPHPPEMAIRLGKAFGGGAETWCRLIRICAPAVRPSMDARGEFAPRSASAETGRHRWRTRSIRTEGRFDLKLAWFVGVDWVRRRIRYASSTLPARFWKNGHSSTAGLA